MANLVHMNVYYENDVIYSSHSTFHGYCGIPFRAAEVKVAMEKLGLDTKKSIVELINEGGWVEYQSLNECSVLESFEDEVSDEYKHYQEELREKRIDSFKNSIQKCLKNIKPRNILEWAEPLKVFQIRLTPNLTSDSYTLSFNNRELTRVKYEVNYIPQALKFLLESDDCDFYSLIDLLAGNNITTADGLTIQQSICRIKVYFMNARFCSVTTAIEDVDKMINALIAYIEHDEEDWMSFPDYWFFEVVGIKKDGLYDYTRIEKYEERKPVDLKLFESTCDVILKEASSAVGWGFTGFTEGEDLKTIIEPFKRFGFSYEEINNGKVIIDDGGFNIFTFEGGDKALYFPRLKAALRGIEPIKLALDSLELKNDYELSLL